MSDDQIRVDFESDIQPIPNSGIEWYPEKQAYMTRIDMFKSLARGRTDAFEGYKLAHARYAGGDTAHKAWLKFNAALNDDDPAKIKAATPAQPKVPDGYIELLQDISEYLHDVPDEADGGDCSATELARRCRTMLESQEGENVKAFYDAMQYGTGFVCAGKHVPFARFKLPGQLADWPEYHEQGMGCGLEDRGITDRYEAMRYGWDEAMERMAEMLGRSVDPEPEKRSPQGDILEFSGEYRWLSNFWPCPGIKDFGRVFPSIEHAYQAAKMADIHKDKFIGITAGRAKALPEELGHQKGDPLWEKCKVGVMRKLIRMKFAPGTELAAKLIATGDCQIVEGNTWGDTYWGVCGGVGQNMLGKLIMDQRQYLISYNK